MSIYRYQEHFSGLQWVVDPWKCEWRATALSKKLFLGVTCHDEMSTASGCALLTFCPLPLLPGLPRHLFQAEKGRCHRCGLWRCYVKLQKILHFGNRPWLWALDSTQSSEILGVCFSVPLTQMPFFFSWDDAFIFCELAQNPKRPPWRINLDRFRLKNGKDFAIRIWFLLVLLGTGWIYALTVG